MSCWLDEGYAVQIIKKKLSWCTWRRLHSHVRKRDTRDPTFFAQVVPGKEHGALRDQDIAYYVLFKT